MIAFPGAKINLGLNIVANRKDGYHDLETIFYPIPLYDALEITSMDDLFPSEDPCDLKITGSVIPGSETDNLVIKAYKLLAKDFALPRIHIHLNKRIPLQAGLGGGSSDAAFMIKLVNESFDLKLNVALMEKYAAKLGADCAFFISGKPAFATGIGDHLSAVDTSTCNLKGYFLMIVKPAVAISTKEAYANITTAYPQKTCLEVIQQPIETWKDELSNDFENSIFPKYPTLNHIKEQLYAKGAIYAAMSGSGSTIFGIFKEDPSQLEHHFNNYYTQTLLL